MIHYIGLENKDLNMVERLFYKSAWIQVQNERVLVVRSRGNPVFFLPGGGLESGETHEQALIREIREELSIEIIQNGISHLGMFIGPSYEAPETTNVQIDCYTADFYGELAPASEVEEISWFGYKDKNRVSKVDGIVFDYLKDKAIIS